MLQKLDTRSDCLENLMGFCLAQEQMFLKALHYDSGKIVFLSLLAAYRVILALPFLCLRPFFIVLQTHPTFYMLQYLYTKL